VISVSEGPAGARVFLALGSNQGDRAGFLRAAKQRLSTLEGTVLVAESNTYVTAPLGGPVQDDYLNQVLELRTSLAPGRLLAEAMRIEQMLGRERTVKWGPRSIDIDILWYDGCLISQPGLEIPHSRMEERRFVLEPLAELAPGLVLKSGRTVERALSLVSTQVVALPARDETQSTGCAKEERGMDHSTLQEEIRRIARNKGAVILAHNYQRPEVQDVADFLGDSLGLSREAAASGARIIVFCGVHFMAETAAILAPDKRIVLPELRAGCPMADMVDVEGLKALKAEHPEALVVSYVNTSAEVKALSDICCTSANAVRIVQSIPPGTEIIFTPDRNLGAWAAKQAGRNLILWPGFCPTHELIEVEDVVKARAAHPRAKVVVHPECRPEVAEIADAVESTSGMIRFCREDDAGEYLIGTEMGMIYRLSKDVPDKIFYPVTTASVCPNMKLTTLDKVLRALQNEVPVVTVPAEIRALALRAVQRMVEVR